MVLPAVELDDQAVTDQKVDGAHARELDLGLRVDPQAPKSPAHDRLEAAPGV